MRIGSVLSEIMEITHIAILLLEHCYYNALVNRVK